MVFSSMVFLCGFLPLVLIIYYLCPGRFRNFFLLIASLFFYAWGEPKYIGIMLFSTVFDYCNGRMLEYLDTKGNRKGRKIVLVLSVAINLGIMCFFKYTDFLLESINQFTGSGIELLELALPIGISFYTFQTLSYTIDVYRHQVPAQKNIINFGMYVCLFPQLIAGPIVRYCDVEKDISGRKVKAKECAEGMQRFLIGLGKKVIFANQIGLLWTEISSLPQDDLTVSAAWLGALAYTFQIYFDFSGYSDMAIGLGKMFGFHFPENFRYPYQSKSITEFWRRWHITLGVWFREYLYIPLGGNRQGILRHIFNMLVVWFLTGLWHGAGWNFILWGLYFFVILLIEKLYLLKEMENWHSVGKHLYAAVLIVIGWAIFACDNMELLIRYMKTMFGVGAAWSNDISVYYWCGYGIFLIVLVLASLELPKKVAGMLCKKLAASLKKSEASTVEEKLSFGLMAVYTFVILLVCMAFLVSGSYNPFLYFRF